MKLWKNYSIRSESGWTSSCLWPTTIFGWPTGIFGWPTGIFGWPTGIFGCPTWTVPIFRSPWICYWLSWYCEESIASTLGSWIFKLGCRLLGLCCGSGLTVKALGEGLYLEWFDYVLELFYLPGIELLGLVRLLSIIAFFI